MAATTKAVIVGVIRAIRGACTICRRFEIRYAHLRKREIRKCPQQKKDGEDAIHSCYRIRTGTSVLPASLLAERH